MNSQNVIIISTLLKTLKHTSDKETIRLHLAKLYIEECDYEEALEMFQSILEDSPVHLDALRGGLFCAQKLSDDALIEMFQLILSSVDSADSGLSDDLVDDDVQSIQVSNDVQEDELESVENVEAVDDEYQHKEPQKLKLVSNAQSVLVNNVVSISPKAEITLNDVAGLEDVKKRLELSFLAPINNPQLAQQYNIKVASGLLLYGPPGCGKTHIARALAGEINATFMSIGIDEVLDMWVGNSEKNLASIYQEARRKAPAVIFFDEIDAIGQKRGTTSSSSVDSTVNQLLMELDGIKNENDGVFTLAATNLPWKVDSALRRPGRFDRSIFVSPPDEEARKKIFEMNLQNRPTESIDIDYLVKNTHLYSAADIRQICDFAAERCLEKAMLSGEHVSITNKDFELVLNDINSSVLEWFHTVKSFITFSNNTETYEDVSNYMKTNKLL